MANVTLRVGTNTDRNPRSIDISKTPAEILEAEGIDFGAGTTRYNGIALNATEMNAPISSLNPTDGGSLIVTIKADAGFTGDGWTDIWPNR